MQMSQLWNGAKYSLDGILAWNFMGLYPWKSSFISNLNYIKIFHMLGEIAVEVEVVQVFAH